MMSIPTSTMPETLMALAVGALLGATIWMWMGPGQAHHRELLIRKRSTKRGSHEASVSPQEDEIPFILDLSAAMLNSGLSLTETLKALAIAVPSCRKLARVGRSLELGMTWEDAWRSSPQAFQALESALAFARLAGASSASLLRDSASSARRLVYRSFEKKAAELGVQLILPLGLCALPAFMLLGVGPLVMSLLPG